MQITYNLIITDEVDNKKGNEIHGLVESLNCFFKDCSYSLMVEIFDIILICVSPEYDQFFQPKRPRYCKSKLVPKPKYLWEKDSDNMFHTVKTLFIEIKIDYQSFYQSDKIEGYTIIGNTLLKYLKEMKYPVAIRKSFDKERFNKDMKEFFQSIGCKLDVE